MEDPVARPPESIVEAFFRTATRYPDKPALMQRDTRGVYGAITFSELTGFVDGLALALRELGVRQGDRVAILARNCPEWIVADLATLKCGAIVVPLYTTLSPAALKYILSDSGSRVVFAGDARFFALADSLRRDVACVRDVVVFDPAGIDPGRDFRRFQALVEEGARGVRAASPAEAGAASGAAGALDGRGHSSESRRPSTKPEDAATIVYTSGTTGEPKGVVLSHGNILSNVACSIDRFGLSPSDRYLSFLPLSHAFERTAGYYSMMLAGATIAYAEDISTVVRDAQAVRPTCLIVVPRVLEKAYDSVRNAVAAGSPFRRRLVESAVRTLHRRARLRRSGRPVPVLLGLACAFHDLAVARKLRNIAGGRLRLVVSGGAPLDRKLSNTLSALGFRLFEGYGLTETSPCVSCTWSGNDYPGTVGKPYDGVEVRIGEDSEVLVRGPNVMKGYFNKPLETARAIDTDGWFHTGDQGRFDRSGNLIITGRIKELIITSYGKNIAPVPIETAIKQSDYVEDVMLHGDREKYLVAIVVPRREAVERYARERGLAVGGYEALLDDEAVRALISSELEKATAGCSRYEKLKAFTLVSEGFTVANDLITPTLKLRRERVREKYRDAIETMYGRPAEGRGTRAG